MIQHDESGYSIVEVMVAILILMAAILPMFKMFDVSLQTATRSSDYDQARALAEKQAEIAQSVTFEDLKTTFPKCNGVAVSITASGTNCKDDSYSNFIFSVTKSYVKSSESGGQITIVPAGPTDPPDMIKVIIEVKNENNPLVSFRTVGVIANNA